jgi:hypothetical protein
MNGLSGLSGLSAFQKVAEEDGLTLPHVASATLLLDLEADTLSLSNDDPVSTWQDQSGNAHHFAQAGALRPIYVADDGGYPAVYFGGFAQPAYMTSPAFADSLSHFAVFIVSKFDMDINDDPMEICKIEPGGNVGWIASSSEGAIDGLVSGMGVLGDTNWNVDEFRGLGEGTGYFIASSEWHGSNLGHAFVNGNNDNEMISGALTGSFSNSEDVMLGGNPRFIPDDTSSGWLRAVLMYQINDLANWATDRAAITAWLANRYGITL